MLPVILYTLSPIKSSGLKILARPKSCLGSETKGWGVQEEVWMCGKSVVCVKVQCPTGKGETSHALGRYHVR